MDHPPIARRMRPNRHPLDDDSAARMLQGLVQPDDAPPGYGAVAGLLATAARPAADVDEHVAATTVTAMVEAIREGVPAPQTSRRKSMLTKLLAGKALAALGVVALTASGAAAATGSLPSPVQSAVSGAASHVGVDLPSPNHGNSANHRQDAKHGHAGDDSTPTTAGTTAGSNENHGSDVSNVARTAPAGPGHGATVCHTASDGKCDGHGQGSGDDATDGSGEDHAVTPTTGSIQTGDDHNGDHATTPTTGSIETGDDHRGDQATTPTTGSVQTGDDHSDGSATSGKDVSGSHH
jgi:hypothetical protein